MQRCPQRLKFRGFLVYKNLALKKQEGRKKLSHKYIEFSEATVEL